MNHEEFFRHQPVTEKLFWDACTVATPCRVLELGSKIHNGGGLHRKRGLRLNHRAEWTGVDIESGPGVDVVADAHDLESHFPAASFDLACAFSTFEHLARPWIVAEQLFHVVRPGGLLVVTTHQTFPYHPYPQDFFRFSTFGLCEVLKAAGWRIIEACHQFPCRVVPLENYFTHAHDWNFSSEAWLNVSAFAERA